MNKRVLLLTGLVLAFLLSTACTARPEDKPQATAVPSDTPSPAATFSPTATYTPTFTPLPTDTPAATPTHTFTPKPTIAPTHTPTPRPTIAPAVTVLAYWPFDGDLKDASGNGYDLQQTTDNLNFVSGFQGQAIHFNDDPASYLTREQDDPIFDFGKHDYSVELWVTFDRITSQSHEQTLIEKCSQEGGCGEDGWSLTVLDYGPDTLRFVQNPGPHGPTDTPTLFTQSEHWYHVVVARQDETVYLYVDGQQVMSGRAYDVKDTDHSLILGRRADETQLFPLIGALDEVTIYQGALSAAEVQAHYQRAEEQ